jgi:hypothetical protein
LADLEGEIEERGDGCGGCNEFAKASKVLNRHFYRPDLALPKSSYFLDLE